MLIALIAAVNSPKAKTFSANEPVGLYSGAALWLLTEKKIFQKWDICIFSINIHYKGLGLKVFFIISMLTTRLLLPKVGATIISILSLKITWIVS